MCNYFWFDKLGNIVCELALSNKKLFLANALSCVLTKTHLMIKVKKSHKQFFLPSILPKNEHISFLIEAHLQYHRLLDKKIDKTDIQFWAVLGSWGCREKKAKLP